MFILEVKDVAGYKIKLLSISGSMDSADSNALTTKVKELINQGFLYLIADMTQVNYINSSGMLDLLCSQDQLKQSQGTIKFFGFNKNLYNVLDVLGLLKMVKAYDSADECIKAISDFIENKSSIF